MSDKLPKRGHIICGWLLSLKPRTRIRSEVGPYKVLLSVLVNLVLWEVMDNYWD